MAKLRKTLPKNFEEMAASGNVEEIKSALKKCEPNAHYSAFDDGTAPISVKGTTWTQQYNELWERLVPGSGKAEYVQGEAIRIIGRLSHEVLDNGGSNWDADFRAMRDHLAEILSGGKPADAKIIQQIKNLSPNTHEESFNSMAKAVVEWILANPDPVKPGEVIYQR